jgi:hypothetical protein
MDSTTPVNNPPWNIMHTPEQRYRDDPLFRQLVDAMQAWIERADFTPSELRQAAVFASIRHAQTHIRHDRIMLDRDAAMHLRSLEQWCHAEEVRQ